MSVLRLALPWALALAVCGCGPGGSGAVVTPPVVSVPSPDPAPLPATTTPVPAATVAAATTALLKGHLTDHVPTLMMDPPTIQSGIAGSASAISGAQLVAATSSAFRYIGVPRQDGIDEYGARYVRNDAVVNSTYRGSVFYIEFVTDAVELELAILGTGRPSAHRILVDGDYARFEPVVYPSDGRRHLTHIRFPDARMRVIRIESLNASFGGVLVSPSVIVQAAPVPTLRPVRAVFFGSSTIEGLATPAYPFDAFAPLAGRRLGWSDLYVAGIGGTGFAPHNGLPSGLDRLAGEVYQQKPDVLVIALASNDSDTEVATFAGPVFDDIQAHLPDTLVIVLGPWQPQPNGASRSATLRGLVAGRRNFMYVDNVGERWQTGTGNVAAPKGDGNNDIYVSPDGIHFTPAGHDYIAQRFDASVRAILRGL